MAHAELRRAVKLGLKGAMVWGKPPADRPYTSTIYDPFWAAAQELEVPVLAACDYRKEPEQGRESWPAAAPS